MTSDSPSGEVWTSEPPITPRWFHVEDEGPREFQIHKGVVSYGIDEHELLWVHAVAHGARRSVLPIPSAERIAALEALAKAVRPHPVSMPMGLVCECARCVALERLKGCEK